VALVADTSYLYKPCNRCDKFSWYLFWNEPYGAFICGKCCNEIQRHWHHEEDE
jgi:hypothetical protein